MIGQISNYQNLLQLPVKMVTLGLALPWEGEMQALDILIYPPQTKENLPLVTITLLNNQIFKFSSVLAVDTKCFHQNYDLPVLEIVLTLVVKGLIKRGNVDPKAPVKQVTADTLKCFSIISIPLTQPADKNHYIF